VPVILDDPSLFKPVLAMHGADAQPWDRFDPAIPKFERYPPDVNGKGPAARGGVLKRDREVHIDTMAHTGQREGRNV